MGNGSAESDTSADDWGAGINLLSLVLYCIIFVVGTVGNGLVIYVTGFRMKQTVNSVWFFNLALADFVFTTFLIFTIISTSQHHEWYMGRAMCKLNTFVTTINMFASVFTLLAISVDRCLASRLAVWAHNKRTVRNAKVVCLLIWVMAMACSVPYASSRDILTFDDNVTICFQSWTREQKQFFSLFRFIAAFLVPFVGICICYIAIYCRAKRMQNTRKGRARRIIIAIILAFFFCWMPFHMITLSTSFSQSDPITAHVLVPLSVSLAFLNSCLNPVLYVFMCDDFQKKLQQSVCHVLESALIEEHLSFVSSRSMSAHFSRMNRKSESCGPGDKETTTTSSCPDNRGVVDLEANDRLPNND